MPLSRCRGLYDSVVHLAAYGSVVDSVEDPFENFDVNMYGTLVLLRACASGGVEKFVFASTGGALIGNTPPPVDETTLPWAISPYGASKLGGEAYGHAFAGSFGLPVVALRFANIYGPISEHKKGAVTTFIKRARRREPLVTYGDGTATRDVPHADHLCDGICAAIDAPLEDEVVHLASGEETSNRGARAARPRADGRSRHSHPLRRAPARRDRADVREAAAGSGAPGLRPHPLAPHGDAGDRRLVPRPPRRSRACRAPGAAGAPVSCRDWPERRC